MLKANPAAVELARREDGLAIRRGTLELTDARAAQALALALAAAASPPKVGKSPAALDFSARRGEDQPPYLVSVRPILDEAMGPLALVMVHDPLGGDADEALLRAVFGLTPAEAQLAQALRQGISPDAYAKRQNLSRNTVYSHLGRLKDKCAANRLVELIRILNGVRSNLAPPSPPGTAS